MSGDPILDGITRWTAFESLGGLFQGMNKRPTGKYVLFSDLPALLAAAREDERQRVTSDFAEYLRHMEEWQAGYNKGHAAGVEQGQRDEREACAAYIAARGLPITAAAIRAREEKP